MAEESKSPDQIRLVMATAKRMFRWARAEDIIDANPMDGVKLPSGRRSNVYYDEGEIARILEAVREERGEGDFALVQLLALTGMRKSEAFALRWSDLRDDMIRVERAEFGTTKNGEDRVVPMHPHLSAVLSQWKELCPATDLGLIFPQRGRGLLDEPKRRRRAKLRQDGRDDLRWFRTLVARVVPEKTPTHPVHALRHSFGSFLAQRGTYQAAIMSLMGHRTTVASQRYLHANPQHLREHIAALPALAPAAPANVIPFPTNARERS
jgi:integrase